MKVAVLFVGRIFGFEKTIPYYLNGLFGDADVDIFVAHNAYNKEDIDLLKSMSEKIHATSELYELPGDPPIKGTHPTDPRGYYNNSKWYNLHKVYTMMKDYSETNSVHYDCVVVGRTDAEVFHLKINPVCKENTLYIPNFCDCGGIHDQMAWGKMEVMKIYCDLYTKVNTKSIGEIILKEYLNTTTLTIQRVDFTFKLMPGRHIHNPERNWR